MESISKRRNIIDKYMNKRSTLLLIKTIQIKILRWVMLPIKLAKTITHRGCLDSATLLYCSEHKLVPTLRKAKSNMSQKSKNMRTLQPSNSTRTDSLLPSPTKKYKIDMCPRLCVGIYLIMLPIIENNQCYVIGN